MTRDGLQRALIDLGWISLIHRVLGGRPAESYALRHLMRCAGRPVTYSELASEYEQFETGGGSIRASKGRHTGTANAIRKRVERLRRNLEDIGLEGVITTGPNDRTYLIERNVVPMIERALLFSCGIDLSEAHDAPRAPPARRRPGRLHRRLLRLPPPGPRSRHLRFHRQTPEGLMNHQQISEKVTTAIAGVLGLTAGGDPSKIVPDAVLVDGLGFDSLHFIDLALCLETDFEDYAICITDDDIEACKTVSDTVEMMARKIGGAVNGRPVRV